ncbi:MAG: hypothetical protein AAF616_04765 [Bacteroidota bacterium]
MNKLIMLAALVIAANVAFGQDEWKKQPPLDNGTHLLFTVTGLNNVIFEDSKSLLGLDWGNTFNVYKLDNVDLALGIRISWVDIGFRSQETDLGFAEVTSYTALGSFFGIGPNVTYKIQDKIGAEVYFKVKPTLYLSWSETSDSQFATDVSEAGIGATNAFGIAGRYDVFTLGVEFGGGTISTTQTSDDGFDTVDIDFDRPLSYTRFFVGLRF